MHAVLCLFEGTAIYVIRHGAFGLCARPSKDHAFSGSASLRHMCTLHAKDHACLFRQCLAQAQDIVDVAMCTLPREARASRASRARLARSREPARGFARPARPARVKTTRARSSRLLSLRQLCFVLCPNFVFFVLFGEKCISKGARRPWTYFRCLVKE